MDTSNDVDPEVQALMTQLVRFLIYATRWVVKRYGLKLNT
jgi:hypothetical protein